MSTRTAVYPGTFDPLTNGHRDIVKRALNVVDRLVLGVAVNAGKAPLFTLDERVAMVEAEIGELTGGKPERIDVRPFDTLLVAFTRTVGASIVIRGLRAISDFEYEFQMAGMNARLDPAIETVFLMASERNQFIASRLVKEIALLGGDVSSFVSPAVRDALAERIRTRKGA